MYPEVLDPKNKEIFHRLSDFPSFYLAGGTALALQIGHRKSVDFDLFQSKEIAADHLNKVKEVFAEKTLHPLVNNREELTVLVDETKVTFLSYPFPVLFKFVKYEMIQLLSVKEIAATKAYTLGRRGSFKDYVDLYFTVLESYANLNEIIEMAQKKYQNDFNARLFLEQLLYLEDVGDTEILFLKKAIKKDALRYFFEDKVREIKI